MFRQLSKAALLAALTLLPAPLVAQVPDEVVAIDILPGWRTQGGTQMTGLRLRLAQGWKTYWRAPGAAGIPPRFDWSGSSNVASMKVHWPSPDVFTANGIRSIGYTHDVVLPLEFTPKDDARPIRLTGQIELGVCETVCVPVSVRVAADLPRNGMRDPAILSAIADQPDTARAAGVRDVRCEIAPISDGLRLTVHVTMPQIGNEELAVVELPDQRIWVSEANVSRDGARLSAAVDMVPPSAAPFSLDRSDVRITVLGAGRAVSIEGCTGP